MNISTVTLPVVIGILFSCSWNAGGTDPNRSEASGTSGDGASMQEPTEASMSAPRFGTEDDVAYADQLWKAMDGYTGWRMASDVYPGRSPHGAFLRMYSTFVRLDERDVPVIVKDNYAGEEDAVRNDPREQLAAVTVMVKRADGYDPEHKDWFYVKYGPDGAVQETPDGTPIAGRVTSCTSCHDNAGGHDYLFHND